MRSFTDLPIKWKLTLVVTLTCCIALVLVSATFIATEVVSLRRSFLRDISSLAEVIGTNASVALTFEDAKSANEILASMRARPDVVAVRLYTKNGEVLGAFDRTGDPRGKVYAGPERDGQRFERSHLLVFRSVWSQGERLGSVFIEADFMEMPSRLNQLAVTVALVMLAAGLVSLAISYRLQRVVSRPILALAQAAGEIGKGRLRTRIDVVSRDEIGTLGHAFNQMAADLSETTVSKDYVDKILQSMEDMLIVTAPDGSIRTCNAAASRLLGYDPSELIGASIGMVLEAELPSEEELERIQETLGSHVEQQYRCKDGRRIPVSLSASIMRDDEGRAQGFVFVAQDITERRRTEEALHSYYDEVEASRQRAEEQADKLARQAKELTAARNDALEATRLKSEFLANMSHEIRTPMNGIIGMTQLALETDLSSEQREYLDLVSSSAHSLLSLLNDILDFSKIEAGKLDLEAVAFSLRRHLSDTLKPLAVRARTKQLEVVWQVDEAVPDDLKGDPSRLRQVLVNLVGNAIKFTDSGAITVAVSVESAADSEAVLRFDVSDTGIGIPSDKRELIFEAFRQVDGSTSRKYGGTGLGLAISTQLVTMMGGRIWLDSVPGKGSVFHFTASFAKLGAQAASQTGKPNLDGLRGLRALVASDQSGNGRILVEMLRRWGMRAEAAPGAAEVAGALRLAREQNDPHRLVILDLRTPGADGFDVAAQVRADPGSDGTGLILLASAPKRGDAARCRELGVAAYLTLPVRAASLLQAVTAILEERRLSGRSGSIADRTTPEGRAALRILLAEDNPVNRALAVRLLEKRGHSVRSVADGKQLLAAHREERFDLLLTDLQMPEMDGFEATAAIRAIEKDTGRRLPIIALTAHAMKGDRERCLAADMDGYLTKPIEPEVLYATLDGFATRFAGGAPAEQTGERPPAAVSPAAARPDLLDRSALLANAGGESTLAAEIVELFLEESPRTMAAIRAAAREGDAVSVGRTAHRLKGSLGVLGAGAALAAVQRLEAIALLGEPSGIDAGIRALESEMQALTLEIEALKKEGVAP